MDEVTMERIELQIDERILQRVRRLAEAHHCSLDDLLRQLLEELPADKETKDTYLGMLSDEPELMDLVLGSAMKTRAERLMRHRSD
jgi:hypothetical protein